VGSPLSQTRPPALAASGLTKRFGGVIALDRVRLTIERGEVHALLGENGSGKSTLVKILAGFHAPERGGRLEIDGVPAHVPLRPGEAQAFGLSFVHQDLGLISSLSVLENLRLGELASRRGWYVSWPAERARARRAFERFGIALDPRARVGALSPVDQALLAVVRAVEDLERGPNGRRTGGVLVLDEPTVFLARAETTLLFDLLREIAARGGSVLLVSHELAEVASVADRATVIRDGRNVGTVAMAGVSERELAEMILGRALRAFQPARRAPSAPSGVSLARVSGRALSSVSLEIGAGEVLGITGLRGSGHEELPYLLFGAGPRPCGTLVLGGNEYGLGSLTPEQALAAGIALLPADRLHDGSVGALSVAENLALPVLSGLDRSLLLRPSRLAGHAAALLARFGVRPVEPRRAFRTLSGGNQQRALLAKWLQNGPRLLLLDEPTQGVDVGARSEILARIRSAADEGAAVLCASTDHRELAALCDRVLVFAHGTIAHELQAPDLSEELIGELCLSSDAGGARAADAP
jgi:ribose transport system ATP-binding protein